MLASKCPLISTKHKLDEVNGNGWNAVYESSKHHEFHSNKSNTETLQYWWCQLPGGAWGKVGITKVLWGQWMFIYIFMEIHPVVVEWQSDTMIPRATCWPWVKRSLLTLRNPEDFTLPFSQCVQNIICNITTKHAYIWSGEMYISVCTAHLPYPQATHKPQ